MKLILLVPILLLGLFACASTLSSGQSVARDRSKVVETVSLVGDSAAALVGWRTFEAPPYEVLEKEGKFELRSYDSLSVVRTADEKGEGAAFGRLFEYLSGANDRGAKVAMTAPALMHRGSEETDMVFVLPSRYTAETAPAPTDTQVRTDTLKAARYATIRFAGKLSDQNVNQKTEALRSWIAGAGLVASGEPMLAGYDPPFTLPALRRNEVWIPVE